MDNDKQEMREVILGILSAIAGLTAKVLELEETINKLKPGLYEIKTNEEIIENLNKEIKAKGGKK